MTGARIKKLSGEEVNQFHQSLKQMSNRIKQAGPAYDDAVTLIQQAAEKLLLTSIHDTTASLRRMDDIAKKNQSIEKRYRRRQIVTTKFVGTSFCSSTRNASEIRNIY